MAGPADEIIVKLTADASQLQAGLTSATTSVEAAQEAMASSGQAAADVSAASAQTIADAYQEMVARVTASMGEYASNFDVLYGVQAELDAALAAGTMTADAYGASLDLLDAQTDALNASITADVAAINAQTLAMQADAIAAAEETAALDANSVAQDENAAATDTATASGFRFHGIYGTIGQGLNALMSPLGITAAAIAEVGIAVGYAATMQDDLNRALLVTGDAAGVSDAALDQMRADLEANGATVGEATHALAAMASSGRFAADEMRTAAQAALDMSTLTGESMKQAASAVESLAETPLQSVVKLDEQFHFLTQSEYDVIYALAEGGKTAEATKAALDDLGKTMRERAEQAASEVGPWTRFWHAVEGGLEHVAQGYGDTGAYLLGKETPYEKQKRLTHEYQNAQVELNNMAAHGIGPGSIAFDLEEKHIASLEQRMKALHAEMAKTSADLHPAAPVDYHGIGGHAPKQQAMHHEIAHHIATSDTGWNVGTLSANDRAMMEVEAHQIAARQKAEATANEVQRTQIGSQGAHQAALQEMQRSHVEAMVSMGTMGGSEAIAREQSIADAIYQIKLTELEKEKALADMKPQDAARINAEIVRLQDSHTATMMTLADKATAQQIKDAEGIVAPMTQAFSQVTAGYIEGTLTRQQAEQRMGSAILAEAINRGVQMLTRHIAIEEAKTLATAAATAQRLALTVVAEAESLAIHAASAVKWIVTEAAKAAAGAFSAMAGIPFVGPVLAVAASVAAGAEVLNLVGQVASAEGGWERVPTDGMPTILHKDEQVLPAQYAEGLRNLVGNGGGNTYHYHIHANDATGFEGMLKRNPQALVRALGHAHRTGYATA